MNTSRNLTDLPLEVLGFIFDDLPRLEDRLCLAQVHPNFGLAFTWRYGQSFKNLSVLEISTLSVLLPLCGSSVEHILGEKLSDGTVLKLFELHCPNIQSIKIFISERNIKSIESFMANAKCLKSLTLTLGWGLKKHFGIVQLLKYQPNLTRLHVERFSTSELDAVRNSVNLEELIIDECWGDHLNIHELCLRLKNLRTLKLRSEDITASDDFDGVTCPDLREIRIDVAPYWLYRLRHPKSPSILKWILSHAETLEIVTLNIDIRDSKPDAVVYQILSKCKNLRAFSKRMWKVKPDFFHRVIKIVSENGVATKEQPLHLNFYNLGMHARFTREMAETATPLIITFDCSIPSEHEPMI